MWFIKRGKRTVTISGGNKHAEMRLATFNGRSFDYVPYLDDEDRKYARDYMRKEWAGNPHDYKAVV